MLLLYIDSYFKILHTGVNNEIFISNAGQYAHSRSIFLLFRHHLARNLAHGWLYDQVFLSAGAPATHDLPNLDRFPEHISWYDDFHYVQRNSAPHHFHDHGNDW